MFNILKEKLFVNTKIFKKDILMGVLMVDPFDESSDSILKISKAINTPFCHDIIKSNVKSVFK